MKKKRKGKNSNTSSFIAIAGIFILCVFTVVTVGNLMPKNESDFYYVRVEDDMGAKIEGLNIKNKRLEITTSGDAKEYCVKTTKSNPTVNGVCWKKITNNKASISIYPYKKYYVWIKDNNNKISSPMSINTKDE